MYHLCGVGPLDRAVEVGSEMERLIFEKKVLTEEAYKSWVRDDLEDSPDRILWNTSEECLSDSVGLQEMERQLKLFDKVQACFATPSTTVL